MKILACLRLQQCTTKDRLVFVPKGQETHGIAAGRIVYHVAEGGSWAAIRRMLKYFNVMGRSQVGPKTVDSFTKDIGHAVGRLSPIDTQDDRHLRQGA